MGAMYRDTRRNGIIILVSVLAGAAFFAAIRQQAAVSDRQFLRSMIPHHSGAILMCRESTIVDNELRALCDTIIASQQERSTRRRRCCGAGQ